MGGEGLALWHATVTIMRLYPGFEQSAIKSIEESWCFPKVCFIEDFGELHIAGVDKLNTQISLLQKDDAAAQLSFISFLDEEAEKVIAKNGAIQVQTRVGKAGILQLEVILAYAQLTTSRLFYQLKWDDLRLVIGYRGKPEGPYHIMKIVPTSSTPLTTPLTTLKN